MGGGSSSCSCTDQTGRIEDIKNQIRGTSYNNIIPTLNNLNGPIQGFRDRTATLNNLIEQIKQLYNKDIPFKKKQNEDYEY